MNPKISIITASYNHAKYLPEAIESIINQTYQNWELIVVDDGSTDNSVEIIKSYCQKDSRIKLFQHKNNINRGLKDTLLLGLKHSTTDWIAFLESDDFFAPNNFEEKIKIINTNPNIKFIFNNFEIIGKLGNKETLYINTLKNLLKESGLFDYKKILIKKKPVATFSIVLLKKELLNNVNFNSPVKQFLDYFLWLQVAKKTKFYYLNKKLSYWRHHNDSYMKQYVKTSHFLWNIKISILCPYFGFSKLKKTLLLFKGNFT